MLCQQGFDPGGEEEKGGGNYDVIKPIAMQLLEDASFNHSSPNRYDFSFFHTPGEVCLGFPPGRSGISSNSLKKKTCQRGDWFTDQRFTDHACVTSYSVRSGT